MDDKALILIVDDDSSTRFLARATLARAGFDVEEADDGGPALQKVGANRPDLVLLDVSMPNKDGFEVCSEIRAMSEGDRIPILMMTSLDDVDSINRAFDVGATDFITKPVNWAVLGHRVRYMLRTSQGAEALRTHQRRLKNAQRLAKLGDWEWDLKRDRVVLSDEMYAILGNDRPEDRMDFEQFMQAVHWEDAQLVLHALHGTASSGRPVSFDHRIVQLDGSVRHVHQEVEAIRTGESGAVEALAGAVQDITQRKSDEERIRQLAFFDPLTGLPNRQLFVEHLNKAIARARRDKKLVAVLVLDLDQFKQVNESFGHDVGDELLSAFGRRLHETVRASDAVGRASLIDVARLGGDEFTILAGDLDYREDAGVVAQRVLSAFAQPFMIDGHETHMTCSIGVALFPEHGENTATLLMNADTAMYRAKIRRRNAVEYFDSSMNASVKQRLWIESGLRNAIERDELFLHYQPKVDVVSGRIIGCEALVRWRHPERGIIPPSEFIPIAEESELITDIAEWALGAACRENVRWQQAGLARISVAVNLSCNDLRREDLPRKVERVLRETGLDPRFLDLEVTESRLMEDLDTSLGVVRRLSAMGVSLSIDDFGTGYSSLAYLKRLPINTLKIDRSFIRDVVRDPDDAAIATAIIAMAHSLKLNVVAEGVETVEQLGFLAAHGCDEYQGFLYSRPVSGEDFAALLGGGVPAPSVRAGSCVAAPAAVVVAAEPVRTAEVLATRGWIASAAES